MPKIIYDWRSNTISDRLFWTAVDKDGGALATIEHDGTQYIARSVGSANVRVIGSSRNFMEIKRTVENAVKNTRDRSARKNG